MNEDPEGRRDSLPLATIEPAAPGFLIRPSRPADAELLVTLVRELAIYENLEQHALATSDAFRRHLFGPRSPP